jgi:hypothetical protein
MARQQEQRWCISLWLDFYLSLVRLLNRFFLVVLPFLTFRTQDVSIADTSCEVILFCPFLSLIRCGIRGMKNSKRDDETASSAAAAPAHHPPPPGGG